MLLLSGRAARRAREDGLRLDTPDSGQSERTHGPGLLWSCSSYIITHLAGIVLWVYFFVLNRTVVMGRHHVGEERNTLLLANHQTPLDSFLVGTSAMYPRAFTRPYLLPWNLAAVEHFFTNPFTSWVASRWKCIPVRNGRHDSRALYQMIRVLPTGIGIVFPEGMRSRDGLVGRGQLGAGLIALRTQAKIVPVALEGVEQIFPLDRFAFRFFRRIYVLYGRPVDCSDLFALPPNRDTAQQLVDRVMTVVRDQHAELKRMRAREDGRER